MIIISIYYRMNLMEFGGVLGGNENLAEKGVEFSQASHEHQGGQEKGTGVSCPDNTSLPGKGHDNLYHFAINRLQGDFQLR